MSTANTLAGRFAAGLPPAAMMAGVLVLALAAMYGPVFMKLARTVWNTDEQGHGPIILGVVVWLFWLRRDRLKAVVADARPGGFFAWAWLVLGLVIYIFGRVQNILLFEMGSIIPLMVGGAAVTFGWPAVKICAFPLFFLVFSIPLPGPLVDVLTQPLKQGVSYVAEALLYRLDYPISRSGVILMVGQYQLLVADACAGLNSMFTLEALGLLYMNIVGHTNKLRNVLLAILIVPMSFMANIVRVMILVLVTYHFGDEAGQGFVHSAAGMVLFMVGLVLMLAMDSLLGLFFKKETTA